MPIYSFEFQSEHSPFRREKYSKRNAHFSIPRRYSTADSNQRGAWACQ